MKFLVFSDVHGNLPALELMLNHAGSVDGYICLGDMVDYGPWSNECVDIISNLQNITIVQGNHEQDFLRGSYSGANEVAKTFFDFCYPSFARFDKINNLPASYEFGGFTFKHTILDKNIYPDTPLTLDSNYVIGHSHHQFKTEDGNFVLFNAGSVGQNRKYINVINYLLLETEQMQFELRSLTYDVEQVINELRQRGYPPICIAYYDDKKRV